jgi:hypothetical protein
MFVTQKALSRRDDAARHWRDAGAPAPRRHDPGADADRPHAARADRRFGAIFVPMGERPSHWNRSTSGVGFEFSPILKPIESFRDAITVGHQ